MNSFALIPIVCGLVGCVYLIVYTAIFIWEMAKEMSARWLPFSFRAVCFVALGIGILLIAFAIFVGYLLLLLTQRV